MLHFTDWAVEVVGRAAEAARRLNPDALVRLAPDGATLRATLTDAPGEEDTVMTLGDVRVVVAGGLDGLVDVEAPHDALVLRPAGSTPNARP